MINYCLLAITIITIIIQALLDYFDIKNKKILSSIFLIIALLGLIINFISQNIDTTENKEKLDKIVNLNENLQSQLVLSNSTIIVLKEQNDSLKKSVLEMKGTQNTIADISKESKAELTRSREVIEQIGRKSFARSISFQDSLKIQQILKQCTAQNIIITTLMGDPESLSYATQIKNMLSNSNWKVDGVNQAIYMAPINGIIVKVSKANNNKCSNHLLDALNILKEDVIAVLDTNVKSDYEIIVGAR